ncbi:HAMP domain-containing sensor histidine kinase [Stenoxybacter acetivorans]|uniref:HAMP domain-containing sensor histidine kinase n=1 Tax=Stenoxybacter acetivorans TaxID=422441 RepID=UPI000565EA85|nr:HAMP domain-containing sensor histidine kinase [Stenoxybacter acetivorans]
MKLFQRIFTTFCAVIICAIFVVCFSFWLVQNILAESQFKQQREFETELLRSAVSAFYLRGDTGVVDRLNEWSDTAGGDSLYVVVGDNGVDLLNRPVSKQNIQEAREYALVNPDSPLVQIGYSRLGEEYLFFLRNWQQKQALSVPTFFVIPGLSFAPIWHELILLVSVVIAGLVIAYILASYITRPIHILSQGMKQLASGDLKTRVAHRLVDRRDELEELATQFDLMAGKLQNLVEKERHLLHHVSHEMRSPLARMQAILGLVQVQPEKQEQHLNRLETELMRMNGLVDELLTLSRLETIDVFADKEHLALIPFLQQVVDDNQALAQKNNQQLAFHSEITQEAYIDGNENYLYRAFDNVIRNAIAYSPSHSTISVVLKNNNKQQWTVDVADDGPGVPPGQLPHIFATFYRADSSANKPGTGLGLALTKHIIEKHNGKIFAENRQPHGLVMHFLLPKIHTKKVKTDVVKQAV